MIDKTGEFIACSECFKDPSFRYMVSMNGVSDDSQSCPNCHKFGGSKVGRSSLVMTMKMFFEQGSVVKAQYGGAPVLRLSYSGEPCHNIDSISSILNADCRLLWDLTGVSIFEYGPRLCMLGENDVLSELDFGNRQYAINRIIEAYPSIELDSHKLLYRLRVNPTNPSNEREYDTPPLSVPKEGRLDSDGLNVMYLSSDVEVCVHECRTSVDDNIYVATLRAKRNLRLLDLTAYFKEDCTEFESLRLAVRYLFLAQSHSYPLTRELAKSIMKKGYDGLIYPSHFSSVRRGDDHYLDWDMGLSRYVYDETYSESSQVRNYALFGFPIQEKKLEIVSINPLKITRAKYDFILCPFII